MDLSTKFDGLVLKNPLMPAAGPLVGDAEKMLWLKDQGLGALVAKTISTKDAHIPNYFCWLHQRRYGRTYSCLR